MGLSTRPSVRGVNKDDSASLPFSPAIRCLSPRAGRTAPPKWGHASGRSGLSTVEQRQLPASSMFAKGSLVRSDACTLRSVGRRIAERAQKTCNKVSVVSCLERRLSTGRHSPISASTTPCAQKRNRRVPRQCQRSNQICTDTLPECVSASPNGPPVLLAHSF